MPLRKGPSNSKFNKGYDFTSDGKQDTPQVLVVDTETGKVNKKGDELAPDEEFLWRANIDTKGRGKPYINYNCQFGQAIALMILGITEICVSSPLTHWLWRYNYIGYGIWCGGIFFITGVVGLIAGIWKFFSVTIINMLLLLISTLASATIIVLSALGDYRADYEDCIQNDHHCGGKHAAMAVQLCFGGIAFLVSVYSFYTLAVALICRGCEEED